MKIDKQHLHFFFNINRIQFSRATLHSSITFPLQQQQPGQTQIVFLVVCSVSSLTPSLFFLNLSMSMIFNLFPLASSVYLFFPNSAQLSSLGSRFFQTHFARIFSPLCNAKCLARLVGRSTEMEKPRDFSSFASTLALVSSAFALHFSPNSEKQFIFLYQ